MFTFCNQFMLNRFKLVCPVSESRRRRPVLGPERAREGTVAEGLEEEVEGGAAERAKVQAGARQGEEGIREEEEEGETREAST